MTDTLKPVQSRFIYEIGREMHSLGMVTDDNRYWVNALDDLRYIDDTRLRHTGSEIVQKVLCLTKFDKVNKAHLDIKNELKALVKR